MDIQHLREFLALSKTLNYRIASESLYISQSTLSKHVKALENELGARLFIRNKDKSIAMSENGRDFVPYAERIVKEADAAICLFRGKPTVSGVLKVGGAIRYPPVKELLSAILQRFTEKYPDVDVDIDDIQWQDYRASLLNSVYDIVVSIRPPTLNTEGLTYMDVHQSILCVWAGIENQLGDADVVSLEDLAKLNLQILDPKKSTMYVSYIKSIFTKHGLHVTDGKPLTQLFAMHERGFTLTPEFPPQELFGNGLCMYKLQEEERIPISLVRKTHITNPLLLLFEEEFKTYCKEVQDYPSSVSEQGYHRD